MIASVKKILNEKLITRFQEDKYALFLFLILFLAFAIRVINLNYNSAFNDEAIYIVIGRMGLFANDWWSYGAQLWMAGIPYIYPPMSALAYELGGLSGSRLLNVIFGVILVEEVYRFTRLINLFDEKTNRIAALLAAFLAAFSGIGIFVSKLATYDMPSYLLFMVGINSFLKARYFSNGKYYFLAFFCLFVAFLTKIVIAIFSPILFLISLIIVRSRSSDQKKMALIYFYIPLVISVILYSLLNKDNLMSYVSSQNNLGKAKNYMEIISMIWEETKILILLSIPSVLLIIVSKKMRSIIPLIFLLLAVPAFHLALLRLATLNKHLYLSAIFLSVIVGYGASIALGSKNKFLRIVTKTLIPLIACIYLLFSYQGVISHEQDWKNTTNMQSFLKERIQPGDKVLTEEGGVVVLSLYDKIFPPKSIVTFDWVDYSGIQNEEGYVKAVTDVYFDYIELNGSFAGKESLNTQIREGMGENYILAYKKDTFEVYEKRKN